MKKQRADLRQSSGFGSGLFLFLALFLPFTSPSTALCDVIKAGAVWSGAVTVSRSVVVPDGVVLTVMPGTVISVVPSESTKTDPEYLSPLTEITVRGALKAEGTPEKPIIFRLAGETRGDAWAGIIVDGGKVVLSSTTVQEAESGVYVARGSAYIKDTTLTKNRYGLVANGPEADVRTVNARIRENDYGVFLFNGAGIKDQDGEIKDNRKKDKYYSAFMGHRLPVKEYKADIKDSNRVYGDEVLLGSVVWQGRIEINGLVRVPSEGRLTIMPGTVVEFRRKAAAISGMGENGLLVQGVIIAKGTPGRPIFFRSAEKQRKMGDWDSINIMNSDGAQNIIEYCQIEDAYRGLHFHFSNVAVRNSVLRNNFRGIQFQESLVDIRGTCVYGNKSGLQARDSEVVMSDNYISDNFSGANFLRVDFVARRNKITGNHRDGFRIREGTPVFEENLVDGNRYGLMLSDLVYGKFSRNAVSNNSEYGISLKGVDNLEISGNFIYGNGLYGLKMQDSGAVINGNHISGNKERGIGIVSFEGSITGNDIVNNGVHAVDLEGSGNVSAPLNWWGVQDAGKLVYDKLRDPSRGKVVFEPVSKVPVGFTWPLTTVDTDIAWEGVIHIKNTVRVLPGAALKVLPGTRVVFSGGAGLKINGGINASGRKDARIVFTSIKREDASEWDEIWLEYAIGSVFLNCDFEHAQWGIHSHFTNVLVSGCAFRKNYGGMRFRSGPAEIKNSLFEGNTIGIRAYRGIAGIADNVITKNETGIFVREKGGGLLIRENNIFGNSEYNIRVGDFNYEDVDARNNWWGDAGPRDTIYDGKDEPGIGKVNYVPFAAEPYKAGIGELR